ncbi:hypothetical protein LAWI1_G007913, partial [Lachnellula willkommii]
TASSLSLQPASDVPEPPQKWAEEGFTVAAIQDSVCREVDAAERAIAAAERALEECVACEGSKIGVIVYDYTVWEMVKKTLASKPNIVAAVVYADASTPTAETDSTPILYHVAGKANQKLQTSNGSAVHEYPKLQSPYFASPGHDSFHYSSESVSHTRNLTFLKKHMGGPYFDLEAIWDEHTYFEFAERSVEKTMGTMVEEPYVNHIPTAGIRSMTGGVGRDRLSNFYRHHFIFSNPDDTELELVSRTVGIDRVIDEFVFSFTHNKEIDWLIPGIPPTGKPVRVPFTSVVNIRGDRLYHEHIAWDQASVLVQLGLMPAYLPYPYPLPDGTKPGAGKRFEYKVPAAGADTAKKILDKNSVASNEMLEYKIREVDI